jgi:D-galactose 1-dehydrogenase
MTDSKTKLGIVGVGKIVRDQHLPSIEKNTSFELIACASRNAAIEGIASYSTIQEMLEAEPQLQAVALCMPPQYRYNAAHYALSRGLHVLLEKPPGATVSEVEQLAKLADTRGVSLYATWHSRHGAAVEAVKDLLKDATISKVNLDWKEDVRKWHPNQEWIWQAGGLGVFDPGINALSILTHVISSPVFVSAADLEFPQNRAAPIAAKIKFSSAQGHICNAEFDWRQSGNDVWDILFETNKGVVALRDGGASLSVNGNPIELPSASEHGEYEAIYHHFAEIIKRQCCDVDLSPLKLVADAFLLGDRKLTDAFID